MPPALKTSSFLAARRFYFSSRRISLFLASTRLIACFWPWVFGAFSVIIFASCFLYKYLSFLASTSSGTIMDPFELHSYRTDFDLFTTYFSSRRCFYLSPKKLEYSHHFRSCFLDSILAGDDGHSSCISESLCLSGDSSDLHLDNLVGLISNWFEI